MLKTIASFSFKSPAKVIFGMGEAKKVGEEAKLFGVRKVMVITDPVIAQTGQAEIVICSLRDAGLDVDVYSEVKPEPPIAVLEDSVQKTRESGSELIVGVGGGSSLDTAKAVAVITRNEGQVREYLDGKVLQNRGLPRILLPTTAGTGSEVTCGAVFTDVESGMKKGMVHPLLFGDTAVVDPEFTISMPQQVTASTGIDVLIHAVESYIARLASPITEIFALEAIRLTAKYLRMAYADGNNIVAREKMALASMTVGFSITNAFCGAAHALAYPLGALYHIPHGVACYVVFAASMELNSIANYDKFKKMAEVMDINTEGLSGKKAAEAAIEEFRQIGRDIQLPHNLRDIGVDKSDLPKLTGLVKQKHLIDNNPCNLNQKAISSIYQASF